MMQMLRRILHGGRGITILFAVAMTVLPRGAWACWHPVMTECWDQPPSSAWAQASNQQDTWGIQTEYFDTHMCQNDAHAAWIIGYPTTNDPRFTPYPPNLDCYLTWGPVSLAQAQAAGASFWLLNYSEPAHDSIFWGASLTRQLTTQSMMLAGVYSGDMAAGWSLEYTDLAHLRNSAGDTISYLGQAAVFLFWRFRSDGNENPPTHVPLRFGGIIDNITLSVDDGGVDLRAIDASLLRLDHTPWMIPTEGDSAVARFDWSTCDGGTGVYPPFRVQGVLENGTIVLDTVISNAVRNEGDSLFTNPFVLVADSHAVRFVLDTLNQVNETDETNNVFVLPYFVPPIPRVDFHWITPSDTSLSGDQTVTLRWRANHRPEVPATLTFYASAQIVGCTGQTIPGGSHQVNNGEDSLVWDLSQFAYGVSRHVFVHWLDQGNDSCIAAPHTVIRLDADVRNGSLIPTRFYLNQNYPNPFNPTTDLEYGVAKNGHVTLTVFDILGREVAVLVNGQRSPGVYKASFDASKLPSGLYLYKLTTPEGQQTRKMMLLK